MGLIVHPYVYCLPHTFTSLVSDFLFFFVHMPFCSPVHVLSATRHYSIHLHVFYFSVHRPYSSPVRVLPAVQGRGWCMGTPFSAWPRFDTRREICYWWYKSCERHSENHRNHTDRDPWSNQHFTTADSF